MEKEELRKLTDPEEIHDQIGSDPIIEVAPVQIIDEEEPPVIEDKIGDVVPDKRFDQWHELLAEFKSENPSGDQYDLTLWLSQNYEIPSRL